MVRHSICNNRHSLLIALALTFGLAGFGQQLDLPDGPAGNATYDRPARPGPRQVASFSLILPSLPFYSTTYTSIAGKQIAFNIVGTDPSLGAATSTIPTIIVPIKVVFASAPGTPLDGTNVAVATANSPIFLSADYTTGGTDLGVTQYGDAIQRAEFWNLPGFSTNYHVLLGTPSIAPTVTLNVPANKGTLIANRIGVVDNTFFDTFLNGLISSYAPDQLPIFLTDNVFEGAGGLVSNCCVLGYHASQAGALATNQTWIYAAYTEPGTFQGNVIQDVQSLSHEVAEWLNDPFVGAFPGINLIAPATLPGQGGTCIINFETGDPLEAPPVVFTKVTNATTYHLQDEVFLPWYLHTSPSFSVNGWYTYLNSFPSFSSLCGAG